MISLDRGRVRQRRAARSKATVEPISWNFSTLEADRLQASIQGRVVTPREKRYDQDRQGFVSTFQHFPQIIIYCASHEDVQHGLAFARLHNLAVTCRSSGHSTAGYSVNDGLVIDVSRLNQVTVDPESKRATVDAGTTFGKLNGILGRHGLHLPGGACPSVCVGGYMQGGGYGFTSLLFGMNCDSVVEAGVALANGRVVTASETQNADLFWAIRGGTGNNFGVLLQVTYRLHPLRSLWGFGITWQMKDAAAALEAIQRRFSGPEALPNYGAQCLFVTLDKEPRFLLRGMYAGPEHAGRPQMEALATLTKGTLDLSRTGTYEKLNDWLLATPVDLPPVPLHVRTVADSRYVDRELSRAEWQRLVNLFLRTPNDGNFIALEPYGGRIGALAASETAFVHRSARFDVFTWVFWLNEEEKSRAMTFLRAYRRVMRGLSNNEAYQNYPNPDNTDYAQMYWGKNLSRLRSIRRKYDPDGLFDYQQSVPR